MDYIEQIPSTDLMYGPGGNLLKVVIVPTPLDAQVIIEAGEYVPINNVVYVLSGTSVTYTVVKNGYISKSETAVITESQNIYVELEKEQENMIYGWSTGVSESWSTPFDLGVYAFDCSLYANHKFYMLDKVNRRMAFSVSGVESWDFVDLSPASEIQYYSGIAYGSSKLMLCGYDGNSRGYYFFLEDIGNYLVKDLPVGFYPVNDLVYGDGKFVIVGANKVAVTENDGESWVVTEVADATFIEVTYGNGKFVAGCLSGKLFVSEDGVNWIEGSQVFSDQISAITYGNGKFVAWEGKNVSTSEDGINWSNPVSWAQLSGAVNACTYGNDKFIAISYQGGVLSSEDGINWNAAGNISAHQWMTVCYGNGKFVASGIEGYFSFLDTQTFYSQVEYPVANDYLFDSDGNIISRINTSTEFKAWECNYNGISFTGYTTSIYPSSGDTIYSDTNYDLYFNVAGIGRFTLRVDSCDYKSIVASSNIVEVFTLDRVFQKDEVSKLGIWGVNYDIGIDWVPAAQNSNLASYSWYALAYDGVKFVSLDYNGHISTSTDGIMWIPVIENANLGSHKWQAMAYDGTKFVALGETGWISTSTDGLSWTAATHDSYLKLNTDWIALAYDGTKFAALSERGYVSTSTDGISWNRAVSEPNLGEHYWRDLVYDGTKFVALSYFGYVSTSTDGVTWNQAVFDSNLGEHYWQVLAYDGTKFIALTYNGWISTSTDGISWTTAVSDLNLDENYWNALTYDGTKFVALGGTGYVSSSQKLISRDTTLDKIAKNKYQYFTIYGSSTTIFFTSENGGVVYPNPLIIDWGDGTSEQVFNLAQVQHTYSASAYHQVKILSISGVLPDITSIVNLYSWDSIFLPMLSADGEKYAITCSTFKAAPGLSHICSSPFKNSMYLNFSSLFDPVAPVSKLVIRDVKEVNDSSYGSLKFTSMCFNSRLKEIVFDKLMYAKNAFNRAFGYCTYMVNVNFNSLVSIYGSCFQRAFLSCTTLTSVIFPLLESIQGEAFGTAFKGCINLSNVEFPSLKYINGDYVFRNAFDETAVSDLYFPSLSPVNVNNGQFNRIFGGNSNLRIHLPINLEGKFSAGKFVAISQGGYVSTSEDGVTWSQAVQNSNLGDKNWHSLSWDGTKFVALDIDGYISNSVDGEIWVQAAQDSELTSNEWQALAYDGTKFVALSQTGYVSTSTDGITWTRAVYNNNLGSRPWEALTYGGTKFVALTYDGYVSTSTDGIIWTQATYDSNLGFHFWKDVAYDGTKFVALTYNGWISTSIDGTTWDEAVDIIDRNGWDALAYDGTKFVALTYDGYVSTSTDGVVWTSATYEGTLGNKVWRALAFKNNFVYDLPPSEE